MTTQLTLNTAQPLPPAIASTAAEQTCCCAHLIERIQAVWNAFCAWITSWISSLFTWNVTPLPAPKAQLEPEPDPAPEAVPKAILEGTPQAVRVPVPTAITPPVLVPKAEKLTQVALMALLPAPKAVLERTPRAQVVPVPVPTAITPPVLVPKAETLTQEAFMALLVNQYDETFRLDLRRFDGMTLDAYVMHTDPVVGILEGAERLKVMQRVARFDLLLHYVANPLFNPVILETLFKLGADPDRRNFTNFTPLHCAVLTGSFAAYKTLRSYGANPRIRHANPDVMYLGRYAEANTAIEIAYQILASRQTVADYFHTRQHNYRHLGSVLPQAFTSKENFGSVEAIKDIIKYEVEQVSEPIHAVLGHLLPRPLSRIIAGYYLTGSPLESGEIVVKMYKNFHGSDSQRGAMPRLIGNPQATVLQQLQYIQASVKESSELVLASNHIANVLANNLELFLMLGSNPNTRMQVGIHRAFTPLHAAVLTHSSETYITLRESGADPLVRLGKKEKGMTCIELVKDMLSFHATYRIDYNPAAAYFHRFKKEAGIGSKVTQHPAFPEIYFDRWSSGFVFGTKADLLKIIAYETDHQL